MDNSAIASKAYSCVDSSPHIDIDCRTFNLRKKFNPFIFYYKILPTGALLLNNMHVKATMVNVTVHFI